MEFVQIRANVQNRNLTLNVQVDGAICTATIKNMKYINLVGVSSLIFLIRFKFLYQKRNSRLTTSVKQ